MIVELSQDTLDKLGEVIASKLLYSKNMPEQWITIDECAALLGKSTRTLYNYTRDKKFPCLRGKPIKCKRSEVERYFKSL